MAGLIALAGAGFEPAQNSSENPAVLQQGGTDSGTQGPGIGTSSPDAPALPLSLKAVIDAWPGLPETMRARILGIVEGATGCP